MGNFWKNLGKTAFSITPMGMIYNTGKAASKGDWAGAARNATPLGAAGNVADIWAPSPEGGPNYTDSSQGAAEANIAPLLSSIRSAGAVREKQAYRSGLANAQARGVAFGSEGGQGNVSGLAHQEIDPRLASVQAETSTALWNAINAERQRLEQQRQNEMMLQGQREAAKPQGLLAKLGL